MLTDQLEKQLNKLLQKGEAGNKAELVRFAIGQYISSVSSDTGKDYDTIIGFSPDGRIYQVEYAMEAANLGATVVAVCCDEGVVFAKETGIKIKWIAPNHRFIYNLNEQTAIATCGIGADGHLAVMQASHFLRDPIASKPRDIEDLVEYLADFVHSHTMDKKTRPLGVNLLIGGLDLKGFPRLFIIDPSGTYWEVTACAAGQGKQEAEITLSTGVASVRQLREAIILSMGAVLQGEERVDGCEVNVIDRASKQFRTLSTAEKKKYIEK